VGRRTGRRDRERARRVGDRHGVGDDHRRGADHALLAQPTCRPAQLAQTVHASTRSRQGSGTAGRRERDVIPRPVADASSSPTPPKSAASACSVVTQSRTGSRSTWPSATAGPGPFHGGPAPRRSFWHQMRVPAVLRGHGRSVVVVAPRRTVGRRWGSTRVRDGRRGRPASRSRELSGRAWSVGDPAHVFVIRLAGAMDQELERLEFDARDAVASQLRGRHGGELAHAGGNRCSWREARRGLRSPSPG